MARKVIWADAAVADLDAAADYISKDSPAYAASFVLQSLEAAQSLGDLSERGRAVPEFIREDIREIFVVYKELDRKVLHDSGSSSSLPASLNVS